MPAGSKMDLLLAKAKPISNKGSASAITYLRKEKKKKGAAAFAAGDNVSEEGGEVGAPATGAEIPMQLVEKTMVRQAVPLQPMEVNGGADIHMQPMEDPTPEQVNAPKGGCDPMGSPCWSRLLAGPVALWREEPMPEQVCWQDL
ncbi:AN1-type zinc finger protein 5-like [Grus japonensis]|uniref:AN1-type zinc finger protein 5-like n=1 Tax=Grus japonensis TaxID=30415 RepID=A0ABC9W209_GRUJA